MTNPKVIFEVMSRTTEAFDRGKKRVLYQNLESLIDYILIGQDEPLAEHYIRQPDNRWLVTTVQDLDAQIILESIGCALNLFEIYERVAFPKEPVS